MEKQKHFHKIKNNILQQKCLKILEKAHGMNIYRFVVSI
ncbi:hypothetical protein AXA84_0244 [Candidatus Phytoplasma oryzae]|uniref:Uncharacterized protein n=1 Tax=Candidatus Phytoplasma oryzae TaxID=203274 RepID=A0A139JQ40_9MOLU|nr:hypothetical protein AXA84_0427 [Candidatus Phytoplasma oryzae]KXT29085.1 hypothetical protein AXA84_0403 [Candidatus Phytoplasma oryzae]KXT29215.1 hypothetical protein AXA84_0244 [Candidatus Phytoplasma oryzae]